MGSEFVLRRQVEFSDTDMAGIVHFTAFFRYMEAAEHAFFRSMGLSIAPRENQSRISWPRVHAECDYSRPLRFEDVFDIHLRVKERREKSIVYQFTFRKEDGTQVAHGSLAVACTRFDVELGRMRGIPIPEEIATLIEPAPEDA